MIHICYAAVRPTSLLASNSKTLSSINTRLKILCLRTLLVRKICFYDNPEMKV